MADDNLMDQTEIERLLNQAEDEAGVESGESSAAANPAGNPADATPAADQGDGGLGQSDIESLLNQGAGDSQGAPAAAPTQAAAPSDATDADKLLGQNDIEKLLGQAQSPGSAAQPPASAQSGAQPGPVLGESGIAQGDVECLLSQAERALASVEAADTGNMPEGVRSFEFTELAGAPASTENATIDLIREVELDLKIELGRTHMYLEDVLKLRKGSVVPLDKLAGDPVDIYVNGRLIARGEVLVMNDNFCVRVAELLAGVSASA